ncbi:MAG: pyruvate ferredoxin oxidoreductase, partial [Anaerolineae bacterium]|nr:pyruvate ferredoxin oxidoreductase [Anaerolineae bacterium]
AANGATFINVLSSCNRGWRHETDQTLEITRLAVETCYWPLYQVENGQWKLTYRPKEKLPIEEFLKPQGRFRHLFAEQNKHIIGELQAEVDRKWKQLLERCGEEE